VHFRFPPCQIALQAIISETLPWEDVAEVVIGFPVEQFADLF